MTRNAVPAIVVAVVIVGLAIGAVLLGLNLLPSRPEAIERGTYVPWLIVWCMIVITALCAITLAAFLAMTGTKGLSADAS